MPNVATSVLVSVVKPIISAACTGEPMTQVASVAAQSNSLFMAQFLAIVAMSSP
jgi:hypothetical protein